MLDRQGRQGGTDGETAKGAMGAKKGVSAGPPRTPRGHGRGTAKDAMGAKKGVSVGPPWAPREV